MNEHDPEKKVRALLEEAHRADDAPSFGRMWGAARRQRAPRAPFWALVPALAVAMVILWTVRPRPSPMPLRHGQSAEWNAPLDFLLQTPGSELLRTVPTFDSKGSLP